MKVTYTIDGALIDVLRVVAEVKAITGMVPEEIETDKATKVKFSEVDYLKLQKQSINESKYIDKNQSNK